MANLTPAHFFSMAIVCLLTIVLADLGESYLNRRTPQSPRMWIAEAIGTLIGRLSHFAFSAGLVALFAMATGGAK